MTWYHWCLLVAGVLIVVGLLVWGASVDNWLGQSIGAFIIIIAICGAGGAYGVKSYKSAQTVRVEPASAGSNTNTLAIK